MAEADGRLGPYELRGELGRGAMGVVYRARREGLDREVALKVLPVGSTEELAARFRREANLAARLRHANIVGVHDVGEADGRLYLAMDLIAGRALDEYLEDARCTPPEAARMLLALADAVGHAHQEGVLHRDIKPGNILLDRDGKPYLADFGLARAIDTEGTEKLSRSGSVLGTPAYMSPEQAQGADIDGRTDLWALGVVGYEMLSNMGPFHGDTAVQVLAAVCAHEPAPLRRAAPDVPRDLESIIHRCLEKRRELRYLTAADLADDLRRFLDGQPVLARRVTAARRAAAWIRRNRAIAATAAAGVLGVAGIAAYAFAVRPAWIAAERVARLARIEQRTAARATAEAQRLSAAFQALAGPDGLTTDPARLAALEAESKPEAVEQRLRAALDPADRPAPDDVDGQQAFEQGAARYRAAPLLSRAAALRGEHGLAYRLDPDGETGLRAAVALAREMHGRLRLKPARTLLQRLRSRHAGTPVAHEVSALLARVQLDLGDWDQARAAIRDAAPAVAPLSAGERHVLQALSQERQRLPVPGRGGSARTYIRRDEPLRLVTLSDGRRLVCTPQRRGMPAWLVRQGRLEPMTAPGTVLPPGTRVIDCAGGDVDGDGTVDLLAAIHRPGHGGGVAVITPSGEGWRLRAIDLSAGDSPLDLIAGDADGDGMLEAVVCMHWQSPYQWLVHWDRKAGRLVTREWAPKAQRPWARAGAMGDLDGDGVPEVVVGTSLHTDAIAIIYHWNEAGPLKELHRFKVWEPGPSIVLPDPGRPNGRLLAIMSEVGSYDLKHAHVTDPGVPPDDGLMFVRWNGRTAEVVKRLPINPGVPDATFLGNLTTGTLGGRPTLLFFADRNVPFARQETAEGRKLRLIFGDVLGEPMKIAPPGAVNAVQLADLDGDGESELIALNDGALVVRGSGHADPPALALLEGEAPTDNEALRRLRAARDLNATGAVTAAQALLEEVRDRFAGSPEAVEADRLLIDAALRRASQRLQAAGSDVRRGKAGAEAAYDAALAAFGGVADLAEHTADRYPGHAIRRRRFLLQGVAAARAGLDWGRARVLLQRALAEAPGADDAHHLAGEVAGLRKLEQCFAPANAGLTLGAPDEWWLATHPLRVERLADGAWRLPVDSHHGRGVFGRPVRYRGGPVRGEVELTLDGSAWSTGLRVGLIPRWPGPRWAGQSYVRLFLHGTTQWRDQGVRLHIEGRGGSLHLDTYRGRWLVRWAHLPDAGWQLFEIRDQETGRLLLRQRTALRGVRLAPGDYVLGVGFDNRGGDCYLSHALHPVIADVRLHAVRVWGAGDAVAWQRDEPRDAAALVQRAGGLWLAGKLDEAQRHYERALVVEPSNVRAQCYLMLLLAKRGRRDAALRRWVRLLRTQPFATVVLVDDIARVAAAPVLRALGGLARSALDQLPADGARADRVGRAVCTALLGDPGTAWKLCTDPVVAAEAGPAVRYLRARGQWGGRESIADWEWLKARRAPLPGTEPPPVVWSGGDPAALRRAAADAARTLAQSPSYRNGWILWILTSRALAVNPEDADMLLLRGRVGTGIQGRAWHGLAERDWRRRMALRPDDPQAALLVAQLYAARQAERETLDALEAAVARGARWNDLDRAIRDRLRYLAGNARFAALVRKAGGTPPKPTSK